MCSNWFPIDLHDHNEVITWNLFPHNRFFVKRNPPIIHSLYVFYYCESEKNCWNTFKRPVIWDTTALMWCRSNDDWLQNVWRQGYQKTLIDWKKLYCKLFSYKERLKFSLLQWSWVYWNNLNLPSYRTFCKFLWTLVFRIVHSMFWLIMNKCWVK